MSQLGSGNRAVSAEAEAGWFYVVDGNQCGPVTDAELARLCAAGRVLPDTLVWRDGFAQWIPFSQIHARIPMAGVAQPGGTRLNYFKGSEDPKNIFGWWWKVVRQNYINFGGRARRKEYFSFALVNLLVVMGAYLPGLLLMNTGSGPAMSVLGLALVIVGVVYYLAIMAPGLAVTFRRLHDSGKSGWYFLVSFVPYVGGIILFVLMLLDSQPGPNQYGPNPKSALRERI